MVSSCAMQAHDAGQGQIPDSLAVRLSTSCAALRAMLEGPLDRHAEPELAQQVDAVLHRIEELLNHLPPPLPEPAPTKTQATRRKTSGTYG